MRCGDGRVGPGVLVVEDAVLVGVLVPGPVRLELELEHGGALRDGRGVRRDVVDPPAVGVDLEQRLVVAVARVGEVVVDGAQLVAAGRGPCRLPGAPAAVPESEYPQSALDVRMGEPPALEALYVPTRLPWLTATQNLNESGPSRCGKYKSAYHTAGFTELYGAVYAATGGVPAVPDGGLPDPEHNTDGCCIGYCDTDLNDPAYNDPAGDGQPWHRLYYKDGYARLQRTRRDWDPRDVFRHRRSVRLPERSQRPPRGPGTSTSRTA
jgi:hypothetical protein